MAKTGGHLGSSLGVVELTVALHRLLDSPTDRIVWDTGHQAYPHKLLTGRFARFGTLRQLGGIGGFPRRAESPHDVFDGGHAGTGLSIGEGLALARDGGGTPSGSWSWWATRPSSPGSRSRPSTTSATAARGCSSCSTTTR